MLGAIIQIQRSLKPDGVFIASMFGRDTLLEPRMSTQVAELERKVQFQMCEMFEVCYLHSGY